MPVRKRKPLGAKDTNAEAAEELSADAGRAKAMQTIAELDAQVHAKCAELLRMADDAAVALKHEYALQLLKLPKKVRSLPLVEFQREYAGDIEAALLARVAGRLEVARGANAPETSASTVPEPPATATRTTRRMRAPPPRFDAAPATQTRRTARVRRGGETPAAASASDRAVPGTARAFRPGEVLYSQSGSPVEMDPATVARLMPRATPLVGGTVLPTPMPGTVVPAGLSGGALAGCATVFTHKPQGRTKATQGRTILVTTEDGRQVVVTDGDLDAVPAELRAEVRDKLLELYATVASVVPSAARRR